MVAGSVLPDTPPFVAFFYLLAQKGVNPPSTGGFFGFVIANGNPNNLPGFMEARFLLNALPLYALVGVVVFFWRREWLVSLWAGWAGRPHPGQNPPTALNSCPKLLQYLSATTMPSPSSYPRHMVHDPLPRSYKPCRQGGVILPGGITRFLCTALVFAWFCT